jgi:hypothetical protein
MELLASVHWVAKNEPLVCSAGEAVLAVHSWNERKRALMNPRHILMAWERLEVEGWLPA